jgi:hypothetical protein
MERKKYTAEFKREAVKLARQDGVSRAKVAQGWVGKKRFVKLIGIPLTKLLPETFEPTA